MTEAALLKLADEIKSILDWKGADNLGHRSVVLSRTLATEVESALRRLSAPTVSVDHAQVKREIARYRGMSDKAVYSGKHVANIVETVLHVSALSGSGDSERNSPHEV